MIINNINYEITSYSIETNYSFKFEKAGKYVVIDGGVDSDDYFANVTLYESKATLEALEGYFESLRAAETEVIAIFFNDGEEIFGIDIDYSGYLACVLSEESEIVQEAISSYSKSFKLKLLSPNFVGVAELPELKYTDPSWSSTALKTKKVDFSYISSIFINDEDSDYGIFKGRFYFNNEEMRNLKRFYATQRGDPFYLDNISGLSYIFGEKRGLIFPAKVRIINLSENLENPDRWGCNITIVEER